MPFNLNVSPEFFFAEGEPYDRDDHAVNDDGNPISVWSALCLMDDEEWADMVEELFEWDREGAEFFPPEQVMEKIQETNTCTDLTSPVEVWIDEDGHYTVKVYE